MNTASTGLFLVGLIALSYGASQHNAVVAIVGGALMLIGVVIGLVTRAKKP